jgi:hypothetical protein
LALLSVALHLDSVYYMGRWLSTKEAITPASCPSSKQRPISAQARPVYGASMYAHTLGKSVFRDSVGRMDNISVERG